MVDIKTRVYSDGGTLHPLKTHAGPFGAVIDGTKRFEYRRNDRRFRVGDTLKLVEVDPASGAVTGRCCFVDVTYLLEDGFGVPAGYCVMSLGVPVPFASPAGEG